MKRMRSKKMFGLAHKTNIWFSSAVVQNSFNPLVEKSALLSFYRMTSNAVIERVITTSNAKQAMILDTAEIS